ncbi:MAG: undecaprenyl phosphate translocase family protein, partial [Methanobacteriaceae archaeon]
FGVIFVGLNPIAANHSLIIIFFSGMLAICAMILPGISGAFILLLIGQYDYMLNALNTMKLDVVITFIVGAVIGLLGFSKVLDKLITNHKNATIAFLIGLMVGTLRIPVDKIVPKIQVAQELLLPVIALVIVGFGLIVILEKKFNYIK